MMTECQKITASGFIGTQYLEEEIRDGYTVSSEMKKVWTIELDLLRVFIQTCNKYNLRYWAGFGTLLGAVRHKGFIPWDDDLDVWMPRDDYERLLIISKDSFSFPYFLQTTLNDDDYYSAFARLRNSNTTGVLVSGNNHCNNGIYIDIYPLDGIDSNLKRQKRRSQYIRFLNVMAHAHLYNVNPSILTKTMNKLTHLPFVHYNYHKTYNKVNELARKVGWNDADQVGIVVFWPYPFDKTHYDKKLFSESIDLQFENITVKAPRGYAEILTRLYGNYTQFPPIEDRGKWHNFTFDPDQPYTTFKKEK